VINSIDAIFSDLQKEYLELDQERATFVAEKAAFAAEKVANRELFERQQKELATLVEQHKEDNNELLRKRQAQYDEKVRIFLFLFVFIVFDFFFSSFSRRWRRFVSSRRR